MIYMQNLTAVVLLTIESLQQKGLIAQRAALIHELRRQLGMAGAAVPPEQRCAFKPSRLRCPANVNLSQLMSDHLVHGALQCKPGCRIYRR